MEIKEIFKKYEERERIQGDCEITYIPEYNYENLANEIMKVSQIDCQVKPATCVQIIDKMIIEYKILQKIEMEEPEDFKDNQLINDYECYIEVLKELKSKLSV